MKKLKVIICPAEREPHVTNVSDTLEALQKAVGGYIEAVTVLEGVVVLCNEEGRLMGLPENRSFFRGSAETASSAAWTERSLQAFRSRSAGSS